MKTLPRRENNDVTVVDGEEEARGVSISSAMKGWVVSALVLAAAAAAATAMASVSSDDRMAGAEPGGGMAIESTRAGEGEEGGE